MKFQYKQGTSVEKRKQKADKIRSQYPDRIPVIVEREPKSQIPKIERSKFLVPNDITFGQFIWVVRKRLRLAPEQGVFLFINKTMPSSTLTMGQIYAKHKDEDTFLYISYAGEITFG